MKSSILQGIVALGSIALAVTAVLWHTASPQPFERLYTYETMGSWSFVVFVPDTQDEVFRHLMHEAKTEAQKRAEEQGMAFSSVGVSVEWRVDDGLQLLEFFGPFDEIIAGRSMFNTAVREYVLGSEQGPVFTPQVVVAQSKVRLEPGLVQVEDPVFLVRYFGIPGLRAWERAGFHVPPSPSTPPPLAPPIAGAER